MGKGSFTAESRKKNYRGKPKKNKIDRNRNQLCMPHRRDALLRWVVSEQAGRYPTLIGFSMLGRIG